MTTQERPLLMCGDMVRATMEGRKTNTRRVQPLTANRVLCKAQRDIGFTFNAKLARVDYPIKGFPRLCVPIRHPEDPPMAWEECGCAILECPYGMPGDRLWVRETFYIDHCDYIDRPLNGLPPLSDMRDLYFAADSPRGDVCELIPECQCCDGKPKLRPAIFMPRWACRIILEITGVRVERVQDISVKDCIAEGIDLTPVAPDHKPDAKRIFSMLWDSLNEERGYGWQVNPWVWVVEFRRIQL